MRSFALTGCVVLGLSGQAVAMTNLVTDPGFEQGNAATGDSSSSWYFSPYFFVSNEGAKSGSNSAATGCVGHACVSQLGSGAFFSQTLSTDIGKVYTLSFYVGEIPTEFGPEEASEFSVFFGGTMIADVLNPANGSLPGFVQYTYSGLVATSFATLLEIHGRHDPRGILFDDIALTAVSDVPEPASLALFGLGAAGILAARCRKAA